MPTVSLSSPAGKWIMATAILGSAMAFIDASAFNVVLPALQKSLNAGAAGLFWILNAYLLMLASLILVGGAMGDKLGRKKVFMAGILVFIMGSAACGLANSVYLLVVFRVLQGAGGALMIPGSLSLISAAINKNERGKAIGTWSAFTTVVTMGGPVLGGALADAGLWRYIFFINVPIGIVTLLMLFFKVEESREDSSDKSPDIAGAVTIALGLALITFGFLRMPALGLGHWQVYGPLAAGAASLAAFIFIEQKGRHPMMPLGLFANATFSGANLLTFFLYAGLGAAMLFMPLNLVQAQGYSQLQSGLTFLPFTVLMVTVARFAGSLADKHGPRIFLIAGPSIAGAGMLALSFTGQTGGPSTYFTTFFPGILLFGIGMAITVAPLTAAVMGSVSEHFSGTASGVNNALTRVAGVFANAIFGALAVLFFSSALPTYLHHLPIAANVKEQVLAQAVNLGNAKAPASVPAALRHQVDAAYRAAFISAYAMIMRICTALAWTGALMGFIFIRKKAVGK